MPETSAVMLFVCAVAAVYLLAACAVARMFLRRVGWVEKPARSARKAARVVLALAAFGLACFAYGYFFEPFWPQVTRVRFLARPEVTVIELAPPAAP
jgi:fatty acid desaturase